MSISTNNIFLLYLCKYFLFYFRSWYSNKSKLPHFYHKTKELVVDYRRQSREHTPITIDKTPVERVDRNVHVRKSVQSCNITIPTKKYIDTKSETQQEVGYFLFFHHILCHFCHFQVSYINELLPEIYSDEHQNWSL